MNTQRSYFYMSVCFEALQTRNSKGTQKGGLCVHLTQTFVSSVIFEAKGGQARQKFVRQGAQIHWVSLLICRTIW